MDVSYMYAVNVDTREEGAKNRTQGDFRRNE